MVLKNDSNQFNKIISMRKVFDLIILFLLCAFLFWQKEKIISNFNDLLLGPCDRPITYHLGEVDPGYGLSKEQFKSKIEKANQIWSLLVSRNLFLEEEDGALTVNLIYSERQAMMDKLNKQESNLQQGKQSLDAQVADYKRQQADFERKLSGFNAEIGKWNLQGGAPEDVFNRLKKQQEELKAEADRLNKLAAALNQTAEKYNINIGLFNQTAKNYNQLAAQKPEAGLYNGAVAEIDIYLTRSETELIHTLAHEMGHALGLNHVSDPNSIMYPYTNEVVVPNSQEKTSLIVYCAQKNWEIVLNKIENNLREKINQVKNEFK